MSATRSLSTEAAWVERNTGHTLTPDEERCIDTLSAIQRPYNWSLIGEGWRSWATTDPLPEDDGPPIRPAVVFGGRHMVVRITNGLATCDFDDLTRLVLAAHRNAVRVDLSHGIYRFVDRDAYECEWSDEERRWVDTDRHPEYPASYLRVLLHARQREGGTTERHPTIEEAIRRHGGQP